LPTKLAANQNNPTGLRTTKLLRVTLRPKPSGSAVAVHPLVDFGFAFESRNANRLDTRTLGQDIPVVFGISHRFETYFCFSHALLSQQFELKSNGMAQSWTGENRGHRSRVSFRRPQ
jgi:hypothetical protein